MNEMRKTIWYVAAAVVLALVAFILAPQRITPEAFLDQGEAFFPAFTNPNDATTLEVVSYDEASGTARPFKVTFRDNQWTIPSHHDYPADAKDRLARTAAGVIGVAKDDFRTGNVSEHAECGVIDPMEMSAPGLAGRGNRITFRAANDEVLADFIVGKQVANREGFRFVRVPGQNRVYAARMDVDLSTRFADWIDTNLLQVTSARIERVVLDNYSINERTKSVVKGDVISLKKGESGWQYASGKSTELDTTKVKSLVEAVAGLSLVGVRKKPEGLAAALSGGGDPQRVTQEEQMSLGSTGFFFDRQGRLLANDGEAKVHTSDGIVYTLRFGEVLYGSELELTAGTDEGQSHSQGSENRYLMVTVSSMSPTSGNHRRRPRRRTRRRRTRSGQRPTERTKGSRKLSIAGDGMSSAAASWRLN
jgi:hypothetical protein